MLTSLLRAKVAAAAIITVLGGVATAAYANALPAPVQRLAHHVIGAPASPGQSTGARPASSATPVGPNATGPAAYGLCTAYSHAKAHGSASQQAVAFQNLAAAAGGATKIAAYCATVPHPGASNSPTPGSHPTGTPTSHPTGTPTSHPTPHATGKPTSHPHPTPHATGKP